MTYARVGSRAGVWKLAVILTALLGLIFALAACGANNSSTSTTSTTSTAAEETTAAATDSAPRVVALDWRYEEILVALDIMPVGIVEIGDSLEPPTLAGQLGDITSVGQAKQPNLEVIQSLEPDLILASPTRHAAIMDQLEKIAPTKSYSDATYGDVLDALDDIAAELGASEQAAEVRQRIEDKVAEAREVVTPGTRVALIGWTKDTLYTWVAQSFIGSLLTDAGYEYGYDGEKSAIESKTDVAELTGDKLPDMNLDVIYLYNDTEGFRASPYGDIVDTVIDVEQDTWSRSRGPLAAEAILDQIIEQAR